MQRKFINPIGRAAVVCLLAGVAITLLFYVGAAVQAAKPAGENDEAAIRAAIDSYVAAYNRGDAKAVAAHWSTAGEWISPSGERFVGRQAIEKEMEKLFAEDKGVHIEVVDARVRIISSDVAVEEGTVHVTSPSEPTSESTYIAVDIKENGRWKLNTVRETDLPDAEAPSSQLQELAWLVGDWGDDTPEVDSSARVSWTKNKTFLNYAFKLSTPGEDDELEGTQVIGWDPAEGTIRSWMFDSDGGFGEGTWTKHGDSWVVKFHQTLGDGRKASATNVYTLVDGNTFTWKSIGRKLDGEFLPNIEEVKMVRKTAGDAVKEPAKPAKAKTAAARK